MSGAYKCCSVNSDERLKKVVNDLLNFQITKNLFCDRNSGTSKLKMFYQNSSNRKVVDILKNQKLKNMCDSDKIIVLKDFFEKQIKSGQIIFDNESGLYPAFNGKTPGNLKDAFYCIYNDHGDYEYKNGFIQLSDKWVKNIEKLSLTLDKDLMIKIF